MKYSTTEQLVGLDTGHDKAEQDKEFAQRLSDFKDTFGTAHGRRTLLAILANTYQHESAMTGNSQTYFNLGIQDYGRSILDVIALADPSTYQWIHAQRANYLHGKYEDKIIDAERSGRQD